MAAVASTIGVALIPGAHAESLQRASKFLADRPVITTRLAVTAPSDAKLNFDRPSISSLPAPKPPAITVATSKPVSKLAVIEDSLVDDDSSFFPPLRQMSLTSKFGHRINPLTGAANEIHTGADFAGACGMPVFASQRGTVVDAGWHRYGGGNRVLIDHGNGLQTTYNHLASIGAEAGQAIFAGQQIGEVGTTGDSAGCHLHFEVVVDGQATDPADWL